MESDNSWCGANRLEGVRTDPSCKAILKQMSKSSSRKKG